MTDAIGAGKLAPADALTYMLAGNATVTVRNVKTDGRFTFKLRKPSDTAPHFVKVLTGPQNDADYRYLGAIFEGKTFKLTAKSFATPETPCAKAFAFVFTRLQDGTLPECVEVWHEGTCGRCGRKLTVPQSIAAGIGPECAAKMGG